MRMYVIRIEDFLGEFPEFCTELQTGWLVFDLEDGMFLEAIEMPTSQEVANATEWKETGGVTKEQVRFIKEKGIGLF